MLAAPGLPLWAQQPVQNQPVITATGYVNGNQLHAWFSQAPDVARTYVVGVWDAQSLYEAAIPHPRRACPPPQSVTAQQLADVVKQYLENHPERRHYGASGSVMLALRDAFPCPN